MRGHVIPMDGGDEFDAFTAWKEYLNWEPGERKSLKRRYNKRQRRHLKEEVQQQLEEYSQN